MFAKLKKKLEEGESGGPERLSFSPRRLPGAAVAVRSPPADGNPPVLGSREGESVQGDERRGESAMEEGEEARKAEPDEVKPLPLESVDMHPTHVPSHLRSSLTQETVNQELMRRVTLQQQELDKLTEQLQEREKTHLEERGRWKEETAAQIAEKLRDIQALENRLDKVDGEATELKLQVLELKMEKQDAEQQSEREIRELQERVGEMERAGEEERKRCEAQVQELEKKLTEKDNLISDLEFRIEELEEQVSTLETSKMEAIKDLSQVSQDEALRRLQNEVIDLEKRLRSKTLEIELTRTNAEAQIKWKEDQLQEGVSRQQSLMKAQEEMTAQLQKKREELHELRQELDKERQDVATKEKEITRLSHELEEANQRIKQLDQQIENLQSSHARHLQDMASQRDARVAELSQALEELRRELLGAETIRSSEEKSPLDYATAATQTDPPEEPEVREDSVPAVLPVNSCPEISINGLGGSEEEEVMVSGDGIQDGTATMQSHGLLEELQVLRQEQLRLQEEVTEKNKLIRFQQLKIVDMRKALNKELQRSQSSQDLPSTATVPSFPPIISSPNLPWQKGRGRSPTPPPPSRLSGCDDTNFQYLKHVVIKFLCSREDEASQLIRALSTLLEFTPQEEQFVKDYFDYKMSWFGTMPLPPYHPMKRSLSNRHT